MMTPVEMRRRIEIAAADGTMLRLPQLVPFVRRHGLAIISIADLVAHRQAAAPPGPTAGGAAALSPGAG